MTALDAKIAELDARTRRLRRAAADRDMPVSPDEVGAVERAVAEFERAAEELVRARGDAADLGEDLKGRRARIDRLSGENDETAELLGEKQDDPGGTRTRNFAFSSTPAEPSTSRSAPRFPRLRFPCARRERSRRPQAVTPRRNTTSSWPRGEICNSLAGPWSWRFPSCSPRRPCSRPTLTATCARCLASRKRCPGLAPAHGPGRSRRPPRSRTGRPPSSAPPADANAVDADPVDAIRAVLPVGVTALLDAYTVATRGGRAITDGVLKNAVDRMWSAYREFENALKAGEDGYQADLTGSAPFIVDVATNEGRKSAAAFARKIAEDVENQGVLLEERERTVLEDSLLTALAQQIHSRVLAAKDLVAAMDADTRSKPMSSGMAIGISWVRSERRTEQQAAVSRMLDRDAAGLGPDGLAELRALLRAMIHDHRASNPRDTYREVLAAVLDYRSWHAFELQLLSPGTPPQRLTRKKHSEMSGGEKSAAIHMPLFAAANALYSSSKPTCPRMVALDEAFAGIDDMFKPELLGLTVKFDLDLFMTGHDLWVRYPTVPLIAHYDMQHDKATHALSTFLVLWDGEQLIDADAGYAGNEDLSAELLGFRPTRHVPAQAGGTLVTAVEEDLDDETDSE